MVAYGKGGLTSVKPPDLGTVNIKTKLIWKQNWLRQVFLWL
jgi:hypothetical protein